MNLPNYFLADLPAETTLSPAMIAEACQALKRNREQYLAHRSTASLVDTLSDVAVQWLDEGYSLRKLALEKGAETIGFSRPTLARGLDQFFKQLTRENLGALLEQDLGHVKRLDEFWATHREQNARRAGVAWGPEFLVQLNSGKQPIPAMMSLVFGVLVRSAQFLKCSSGSSLLPRLFAHSIYNHEPKLAACIEVAEWRGENAEAEKILFEQADCVTATGNDERLAGIRQRLPARTRWAGYRHRVSFAFVSSEMLAGANPAKVAALAASDVAAWDQLGYLAPHVVYVQDGGAVTPEAFAELLAQQLQELEQSQPVGKVPAEVSAAIASRRSIYELRAAHARTAGPDYPAPRLWTSDHSTAWTVVFEGDPRFQHSCLHRFIYVKAVADLTQALQGADAVRGKVATVGVSAPPEALPRLALELARWGVIRVCSLGQMQRPSLACRQDGRPALGDLVSWTDWEQ
jgi:hypothetical protein